MIKVVATSPHRWWALQTLTTTSPPPRSIDNGHHYPQAMRIAHPHQLPNPQATTEWPTTHNPGPQTSDEEHPPQPPMNNKGHPQMWTMATMLDRQPPAHSINNSHHHSQVMNAAHQQWRMTWTDDNNKWRWQTTRTTRTTYPLPSTVNGDEHPSLPTTPYPSLTPSILPPSLLHPLPLTLPPHI